MTLSLEHPASASPLHLVPTDPAPLMLLEPPARQACTIPAPHQMLERSIDSLYVLAQHLEVEADERVALARAVREHHDREHEDGWAVCPVRICQLAARVLA